MRVLIGCERSGVMREAFRARGHNAWSCDLAPAEDGSPFHIQSDCLLTLKCGLTRTLADGWLKSTDPWDLFIVHPPCTYLCSSGMHWNKRRPERQARTERAYEFATRCLSAPVSRLCMENPIGILSTRIRKPDQIVQPWQFGDDASKATCLWLNNLPRLVPTSAVNPRIVNGKKRWSNQTDSGQNRLGPSPERSMNRARTYRGIAEAMAEQWGALK